LTFEPERDDAIRRLILAIDQDRAELLAAILGWGGRKTKALRTQIG
jgi:hypothetical protein